MTNSGKVRIYELSRDLGLDNRDVLDAAEKLSIAARSHSSSISDDEASRIRALIRANGSSSGPAPQSPPAKAILSVKKASATSPAPTPPAAGRL
ncbi:MAG: translation initiation factor IF-2 N-terminal domain-containing protein, partial [Cyanobacteriota bacterium]